MKLISRKWKMNEEKMKKTIDTRDVSVLSCSYLYCYGLVVTNSDILFLSIRIIFLLSLA